MIETTLGGYKFPDGTIQTTAAGVASVFHDGTLTGNGTQASPLGIAVPLSLEGSIPGSGVGILTVKNNGNSGVAIRGLGGDSSTNTLPGSGVLAVGGFSSSPNAIEGGPGVRAGGGRSANGAGGAGIFASGGDVNLGTPGPGGPVVEATGGGAIFAGGSASGGSGILTRGGVGRGPGFQGGTGLVAFSGTGADGATEGKAGVFIGEVEIAGNLSVSGTKNFKIDHPLDPENRYLYHAAIESSEVLNIYSGNVTTDGSGDAVIHLPEWFEAINRDFRYQLTVVGQFAQAIVIDEIKHNAFRIKTSAAGVKVSWQVTGVRSDAALLKHPFKLEEQKLESERGYFLNPEAFGQPEARSLEWARNPKIMQELKQQRTTGEQPEKPHKILN